MTPGALRQRLRGTVRTAVACLAAGLAACHELPSAPQREDTDAGAGQWRTWVLANGSVLRPAAPAADTSAATAQELASIVARQRTRSAAMDSAIARWSASPTAPWDSAALHLLDFYFPLLPEVRVATPVRAARTMALLHVAVYDALVATWDAKYAYRRRPPFALDARLAALADVGAVPSYPSEHAAAGAAAAAVLSALFPREDTLALHALEEESNASRLAAGVAYPSDVSAGAAIGRAVAARVLARAATDGSADSPTAVPPTGPGSWVPTTNKFVRTPFDAGAGGWRPWMLVRGDIYRPAPPPALGSPAFTRDVGELRALSASRTAGQITVARYWATDAPSVIWEKDMLRELAARRPGTVRATQAQALASIAMYDAFVACWDAKFAYWLARPVTMDSSIHTVFPTPPFPSYPSGHSTISSAAAEVFAELFPDAASFYRARAVEASVSRVYAGVHYRFDVEAGESLGIRIGRDVALRARSDQPLP